MVLNYFDDALRNITVVENFTFESVCREAFETMWLCSLAWNLMWLQIFVHKLVDESLELRTWILNVIDGRLELGFLVENVNLGVLFRHAFGVYQVFGSSLIFTVVHIKSIFVIPDNFREFWNIHAHQILWPTYKKYGLVDSFLHLLFHLCHITAREYIDVEWTLFVSGFSGLVRVAAYSF